jgi:hypothetical protein
MTKHWHPNEPISITQRPTNEMQRNHPWGDILEEKPINITRIYSQNVNGLKLEKDGGQFTEICKIHQEVQADIICIQEHNLDTTQYKVQQIIHQTTQKHWQRSRPKPGQLTNDILQHMETRRYRNTFNWVDYRQNNCYRLRRMGTMDLSNVPRPKSSNSHNHQIFTKSSKNLQTIKEHTQPTHNKETY